MAVLFLSDGFGQLHTKVLQPAKSSCLQAVRNTGLAAACIYGQHDFCIVVC